MNLSKMGSLRRVFLQLILWKQLNHRLI